MNLKLTDIERIEVLRGPQGTLFGADSVGGTIRTIHNKPDPSHLDYFIDLSASGSDHADKPNDSADVMLNLPVTDRFAVRVNGGWGQEAGFINADNAVVYNHNGAFLPLNAQPLLANPADPLNSGFVTTTLHGINSSKVWYARGDALWKATDWFTAELAYQHQNDQSNGFSFEAPGSNYVIHRRIPLNPADTNTDLGALTLTADFGFGTITSSTSYYNVGTDDMYDNSGLDVKYPYYYGAYPRTTTTNYDFNRDAAFTQEVRLVSPAAIISTMWPGSITSCAGPRPTASRPCPASPPGPIWTAAARTGSGPGPTSWSTTTAAPGPGPCRRRT